MNIEFDYFCTMGKINKILITGASGFVGCRVTNAFKEIFELVTPTHGELDVTSAEEVERFVKETGPDAILHLAAISNTGYCEGHPDESYLANVVSVENLAKAAAAHGCKFVWFSSDQVYNGNLEEGLLSEDIDVSPENHYGRHKLIAEERALNICSDTVALRATWMYDIERPGMHTHLNFIRNIKTAIETCTPLKFATREFRGITWIEEIVRNIRPALDLPGGVYNFGAENTMNTYETACEYVRMLGYNPDELIIADHDRFPEHIRNLSISTEKAYKASEGRIRFRNTLDGLKEFAGTL